MKYIHLQQFWEQLRKNRFFSFLSLFGMSIPIMIIMIMVLKVEMSIHPGGPEQQNEEMLFLNQVKINKHEGGHAWGGVPLDWIEKHFRKALPPNSLAFSATGSASFFDQHQARDLSLRYTNASFWQVFDFHFLRGKAFSATDVKEKNNVVVISRSLRDQLFEDHQTIGSTIELNGHIYRIIGVVDDVNALARNTYAQIWLPYTQRNNPNNSLNYRHAGAYSLTFKQVDGLSREDIKQKVNEITHRLNQLSGEDRELIFAGPASAAEIYFRGYRDPERYEGIWMSYLGIAGKALLFLFLPALNLVSINLTRIQERSQEIAIRKAFGATRNDLAFQVLTENVLLTLLGGAIGLMLAYGAALLFKDQIFTHYFIQAPNQVMVQLNYSLFFVLLGVSMIFSILSGLIPALRISRLHPAYVLKGGAL